MQPTSKLTKAVSAKQLALGAAALVAYIAILLLPRNPAVVSLSLDTSWSLTLQWAYLHGLQFGKDIIFTYGPLGFLEVGDVLLPEGPLWSILGWQLVSRALLVAAVLSATRELPTWTRAVTLLLYGFAVGTMTFAGAHIATLITVPALLLSSREILTDTKPSNLQIGVAGFLAGVLSLVKFSSAVTLSLAIGTVAISYFLKKRHTASLSLVGSFAAGILATWVITGQQLQNFPDYILGSLQITSGYTEAMALASDGAWFLTTWSIFTTFALFALSGLSLLEKSPKYALWALLLQAIAFLLWKQAIVRPGTTHSPTLFGAVLAISICLPWMLQLRFRRTAATVLVVLGVVGYCMFGKVLPMSCLLSFRSNLVTLAEVARDSGQFREVNTARLKKRLEPLALPQFRNIIGNKTVDVLHHHGLLAFANGLNLKPRPIIQSYSAYTEKLEQENANFFLGSQAPDYVLISFAALDHKLPLQCDTLSFQAIQSRYKLIGKENGTLLLAKKSDQTIPPPQNFKYLATTQAALNTQLVELPPTEKLWVSIETKPTLWGRILRLLYKQDPVYIMKVGDDGENTVFRITPATARIPFLLNPLVTTPQEFEALMQGESIKPRVSKMALVCDSPSQWTTPKVSIYAEAK